MIDIHARQLGGVYPLSPTATGVAIDLSGVIYPTFDTSNSTGYSSVSTSPLPPTRIDRAVDYAMSNCENLLRRLAD